MNKRITIELTPDDLSVIDTLRPRVMQETGSGTLIAILRSAIRKALKVKGKP